MVLDQFVRVRRTAGILPASRTATRQLPSHVPPVLLLSQAEQLVALIQDNGQAQRLSALAQQLRWHDHSRVQCRGGPQRPPDLDHGGRPLSGPCAPAMVPQGQGDGPAGAILTRHRATSTIVIAWISAASMSLYSTITLGSRAPGWRASACSARTSAGRWPFTSVTSRAATLSCTRGADCGRPALDPGWFPDLASIATATASEYA